MNEPLATFEQAKRVITKDSNGEPNGSLQELCKEGGKTLAYLTTVLPGKMKGYHLHNVRAARYVCLKGTIKVILYSGSMKEEYILDSTQPHRLFIRPFVATGIFNIGAEEAWLLNMPLPAYDPSLRGEQEEFTEAELEALYQKGR